MLDIICKKQDKMESELETLMKVRRLLVSSDTIGDNFW